MKKYLKLMRVHHYIKNLLVFAALACGGQLFNLRKMKAGIAGFMAFCLTSSAVYVINDILDREKDRRHPVKCQRPVTAGTVSVKNAVILVVILLVAAAACNSLVFHPVATLVLVLYFCLNLSYSLGLKNIPILDITILVSGFLIRIIYGACVTGITVSNWLYLTVISLAFYFSLGKRRNELERSRGANTREVLRSYPAGFLDKNMYMCLALANVFYALWSMDENTIRMYGSTRLVFTVPLVLVITMKYSLDIEGDSDGDPVEVLLHDKILLCLCGAYLVLMFAILYF